MSDDAPGGPAGWRSRAESLVQALVDNGDLMFVGEKLQTSGRWGELPVDVDWGELAYAIEDVEEYGHDLWPSVSPAVGAMRLLSVYLQEAVATLPRSGEWRLVLGAGKFTAVEL